MTAYDEAHTVGILRHIMVRRGHYSSKVMVVLVTRTNKLLKKEAIVNEIMATCPDVVVSLQQNINSKQTNVILGDKTQVLAGKRIYHRSVEWALNLRSPAKSFLPNKST